MYLQVRESVSFRQSIHLELNTLTLNSALLSDTLISYNQPILEFDINYLLKMLSCSAFQCGHAKERWVYAAKERWLCASYRCSFWRSIRVVVQKRKGNSCELRYHFIYQYIQFRHSCIATYIWNTQHTFMQRISNIIDFSTCIHSLEKSLISRGLILWKYPHNDDCNKLNLVQVHISNSFQCIGKHKLFKLTYGQFISVIS